LELLDVLISSGSFVGGDSLDLALTEQTTMRIDLLGGKRVTLQRGFAKHRRRTGQEGHVPGFEGRIWNFALGCLGGSPDELRPGHQTSPSKTGPADRDAERTQEIPAMDRGRLVQGSLR